METKYVEGYIPHLFSWNELSNIINIRPLLTAKRVQLLDPEKREFNWLVSGWNHDPNCYPPSLIRDLLNEMVVVFTDMSRATEKINDFANSIENTYQRNVDAHVYVCRNPELEHPFGAHIDGAHNVIVQCEGETNFKVWDKVENGEKLLEEKKSVKMKIDDAPILDVIMKPGDAIWIPLHYPHLATSLTPRMSVSFPFTPRGLMLSLIHIRRIRRLLTCRYRWSPYH